MGKSDIFNATVQSRGQNGRKVVELNKEIRDKYKVGDPVKIEIRKLE